MNKFAKGESISLDITIRSKLNVLADPDSATISIWDSSNVLKADSQNMTQESTGKYFYHYAIPALGPTGIWRVEYTAALGMFSTKRRDNFAVLRESGLD